MDEKTLGRINVGKSAEVVLHHLSPVLNELRGGVVSRMKADFKAGKFDSNKNMCDVAALCAYDEIEERLKSQSRAGQRALTNKEPGDK